MHIKVVRKHSQVENQCFFKFLLENNTQNSTDSTFAGQAGRVRMNLTHQGLQMAIGLGPQDQLDWDGFRSGIILALRTAAKLELNTLIVDVMDLDSLGLGPDLVQELVITAYLQSYEFSRLKTKAKTTAAPTLILISQDPELDQQIHQTLAVGQGVHLARDLVNMPANLATPEYLAQMAQDLSQEYNFGLKILEPQEIINLGMGCFAAVFQGSTTPARFIILDSQPQSSEQPLVLIGKGITFDTGGISLKPANKMHEMKGDMAGAAAILGLFKTLGLTQKTSPRIVGLLPCTENVPGSRAMKPGDVVTALNGTSVEILNTDAEGRLILADALCYSARFNPQVIVDLATLTGASLVALGPKVAAIFATPSDLEQKICTHGLRVGERFWPMPLWKEYAQPLKSEIADLKNIATREGGAIYAALFLKHFVPPHVPWAHLDIAGPGWSAEKVSITHAGATGFGVRTIWELITNYCPATTDPEHWPGQP